MADALTQALARRQATDPYEDLPEAIRQYYSRAEWLVLTDDQKANLIQTETEPDPE